MKKIAKIASLVVLIAGLQEIPNNTSGAYTYYVKYSDGNSRVITTTQREKFNDSIKNHIWHQIEIDNKTSYVKLGLKKRDFTGIETKLELSGKAIDSNDVNKILQKDFITEISRYVQDSTLRKVAIAIGAWESRWGTSDSALKYKNYFGIKAGKDDKRVKLKTFEEKDNQHVTEHHYFKVYSNAKECVGDFMNLGVVKKAYNLNPLIMIDNLHRLGYATDSSWAESVKKVVRQL